MSAGLAVTEWIRSCYEIPQKSRSLLLKLPLLLSVLNTRPFLTRGNSLDLNLSTLKILSQKKALLTLPRFRYPVIATENRRSQLLC